MNHLIFGIVFFDMQDNPINRNNVICELNIRFRARRFKTRHEVQKYTKSQII